jgi:hypothetical protein
VQQHPVVLGIPAMSGSLPDFVTALTKVVQSKGRRAFAEII